MNHTLYTLTRPKLITLAARARSAINCSRTFSSSTLVLAIGLACLGLGAWTPTKAVTQQAEGYFVVEMLRTTQNQQSPSATSTGIFSNLGASRSTKAVTQQPIGERSDETVTTSTYGQEAIEIGKITLMAAISGFSWMTILALVSSEKHFPDRLLESIMFGATRGVLIGALLGAIWGTIARCGNEKIGWRNLTWHLKILLSMVVAEYYIIVAFPKDCIPATMLACGALLCILLVGPFIIMKKASLSLAKQ